MNMKVLMVDDVGYSRLLVRRIMEKLGHEVLEAASGPEALSTLKSNADIDVVVCDLMMPDMDGIELLAQSRQVQLVQDGGYVPCPPFILLTAADDRVLLSKAQEAGFVDILLKPLDANRLIQSVELIFKRSNRAASASKIAGLNPDSTLEKLKEIAGQAISSGNKKAAQALLQELTAINDTLKDFLK